MKLGTENKKKVYGLVGLLAVLAVVFYTNVLSGPETPPARQTATTPPAAQPAPPDPQAVQPALIPGMGRQQATPPPVVRSRPPLRGTPRGVVQFKMAMERGVDLAAIDPTLRLDLLSKVRAVNMAGGERNLFQFGAAPMPKVPEPKIIPAAPKPVIQGPPRPPVEVKPPEPVKPPPPPIPLKFFGYSQATPGVKRAFFLDGEEIIVVNEGELAKKRYKVVRIGINSVVVEDTEYSNQQTLVLEERAG